MIRQDDPGIYAERSLSFDLQYGQSKRLEIVDQMLRFPVSQIDRKKVGAVILIISTVFRHIPALY